jgi:predicted AlkP superfamily pyrophosphatase or phosphodiesterase
MKAKILILFLFFIPIILTAQEKPTLVVGIVIDQMRYDYIYRYWDKYGNGGFKKLVNEGFECKNARFNYIPTFTAPGHASIFTGTSPSVHGIISNNWFVRDENRKTYCTEDGTVKPVGSDSKAGFMSPRNMLVTTFGDELKLHNNFKSKVIGVALKDRGSILPAGHTADAAYWFDAETGNWITSSFYMNSLPEWVKDFNNERSVDKYLSKPWNTMLPIAQYHESHTDDNPYEAKFKGEEKPVFPHNLPKIYKETGYDLIRYTPFGNSFTKDFAIETIKKEALGKRNITDVITISFSSPDYIGHKFGPQSIEVQDTYLRLDKDIEELITFLEKHIGKNKFLLFLTADHGASHVPAYLSDNKVPAGYFEWGPLYYGLKEYFNTLYGKEEWLMSYSDEQVYFNRKLIEQKSLNIEDMRKKASEFILNNFSNISAVYTASDLSSGTMAQPPESLVQRGFHQKRSGDVVIVLDPGWMVYEKTGTTHGTIYSYDTHIPLLWYGSGIKKGNTVKQVNIIDIAPTICTLLNFPFPNGVTGIPIEEIFK